VSSWPHSPEFQLLGTHFAAETHQDFGKGTQGIPAVRLIAHGQESVHVTDDGDGSTLTGFVDRKPCRAAHWVWLLYRPLVRFPGVAIALMGVVLLGVDLAAGMPWWWSASEGPGGVVFGALLFVLARPARPKGGTA
jgi:hypothetical protein